MPQQVINNETHRDSDLPQIGGLLDENLTIDPFRSAFLDNTDNVAAVLSLRNPAEPRIQQSVPQAFESEAFQKHYAGTRATVFLQSLYGGASANGKG